MTHNTQGGQDVISRADALAAIEALKDDDLNHVEYSSDTLDKAFGAVNALQPLPTPTADRLALAKETVRATLYEGLSWFGTLPEPQGDVPERYHRWDDLGELADRILAALTTEKAPL